MRIGCQRIKLDVLNRISAGLILFVFIICSSSPISAEYTPSVKTGPLHSAAEIDYPPFSVVDEHGNAEGFSVELMRAALDAMGRDVTFRTGPWPEVRGWLEKGEVDALPLVGRTPEREALFDFTTPYMTLHGAIIVRNDETGIRDIPDLKGRRVSVMKGDNAEEFLRREAHGIEMHTVPTFEIALSELSQGKCDAVVMQRLVALRLIEKTGLTDLYIIDKPVEGFGQDFCFAVREGDLETLALLNEGLAIVMANGVYRRLHSKWFAAMQLPSDRPILVGGDRNYPPYEYMDEAGRPAGYNVELTRAIAREMSLDVEIRLGRWSERIEALENGKIDVMQGMFYSPARDLKFDFSQPHSVSHYVAVVRRGEEPPPGSVSDLRAKSIVVEKGDLLHDFVLENGLEEKITAVDDQEDALRELSEGKYDCALVSLVSAHYLIDKNKWTNLVPGKKAILSAEYCFAVSNGQKALLARFSEGLKSVESSGEYRKIYDKWLSVYRPEPVSFIVALRDAAFVIVPLLFLVLLAVIWTWSLRRQVAHKTAALHESMERFKYVFEASNAGKSITMPDGKVNANRAFTDFLGYTQNELAGKRWQDITPPEDIEATEKAIAPLLKGEKDTERFEKRYVHKDGKIIWGDVSIAMRRDAAGNPLYFVTTIVDISDRKKAEEALRNSEEYQRAMISCSPVALYSTDTRGIVLNWNISSEKIFGWSAKEVIGKPLPIVPEDRVDEYIELRRIVLEDEPFTGKEMLRLKKDGTLFPVSLSLAPVRNDRGEIVGILGAAEDITERKNNMLRIEHLNKVLRAIRDVNQLIVREHDREILIREGCRLLVGSRGYESAMIILTDEREQPISWSMEGLAAHISEIREPLEKGELPACCDKRDSENNIRLVEDRQSVCRTCPLVSGYKGCQSLCVSLIHKNILLGYLIVVAEESFVIDDEELELLNEMAGDFSYALSVMNIEEARKQGEAALVQSESRFKIFAEIAPVGIVISDEKGNTLYLNSKFTEIFGYTMEDIPSVEQWWQLAFPDKIVRHSIRNDWEKAAEDARKNSTEIAPVDFPVSCKDGRIRNIEFRVATTGALNIIVFTDITKRKKNEAEQEMLRSQLLQAQKMESVGRLAGGIAHDYNNMLGVIIGYTELLIDKIESDDPIQEDLREIMKAAMRSSDITRHLLAFARKQTIEPKILDLNETVEGMLKMLRHLIGEDIDLSWKPLSGLWAVKIDPSQLDQILANLCVNSRDAISDVGKVTIETDNVLFDDEYCEVHPGFIPGEYVMLAVSDDGCGMDRDILDKLFEPFFTTKDVGKGTGLGLAMIYGTVKQNEGFINVYSEPGKGTTFRIYLPRHGAAVRPNDESVKEAVPLANGETIMVVEDESSILQLAKTILERLGYAVLSASTPDMACTISKEHPGKISLLITDVVMPGMNGRDLAGILRKEHPGLKVLFMSGYTANVIAHHGVLDEGVQFIQKPFSHKSLAFKVRDAFKS